MLTTTWTPRLKPKHDPDAIEVYRFDWLSWLDGEMLSAVAVTPTGVTAAIVGQTTTTVDIQVSGGTVAVAAQVMCQATSSGGRRQQRTLLFEVVQR
jgi:hypothetical protein